jgi:hypothetical protein
MSMLRKKVGDFYLVEKIGTGGISEVFLGLNPRTREKLAFKVLGKSTSIWSSAYNRFLCEVDIVRSLCHPGIIQVLGDGTFEECYYYSMQFMPGGNVTRQMLRGKISVNSAVPLITKVCDAMAYAHEKGVMHRDLKPSNILIKADGSPVVSDFGISRILDLEHPPVPLSGEILGTIAYLAPEQRFNTGKVNQRADVYALGAIFYEMLMGFPPLGKFPWPKEIYPDFPGALQGILEKCLAVEQENRYEHAGLLCLELEKCQDIAVRRKRETIAGGFSKWLLSEDDTLVLPKKTDRIEAWFQVLRTGTTRERLAVVREMVDKIEPAEAKSILKIYSEEGDRVRWGLIRVLGELKIQAAAPLIMTDLRSPFHTECAIEALGKIGMDESYNVLLSYVVEHPENALISLVPLAHTGKGRALVFLRQYLDNEMSIVRQTAVKALASISSEESLQALKDRLCIEADEKVRFSICQAVHALESSLLPDISLAARNNPYPVNPRIVESR